MSDVLGNEPTAMPRWVVPLAVVAVVATIIGLAWGGDDAAPPAGSAGSTGSPVPSPEPAASVARAGSACGGDVEQPLVDAGAPPAGTGLRLLVGGRELRLVDVDAGVSKVLSTPADRRSVTQLAPNGREAVAVLRDPCSPSGFGQGQVGVVDPVTGAVTPKGRGDEIMPGLPMTVVQFDADGAVRLRELNSRATVRVAPGWHPYARTSTAYLVSVVRDGYDSGVPPEIGLGTPTRAALTRPFGAGNVVAAAADRVFWVAGECPGPRCMLAWTTLDGTTTAQAVDSYGCCGAVSADGLKVAFRKTRPSGRLGAHPGPPSDVAVLDTTNGGAPLRVLPGLVLPAKAGLTLTWSPDSQWLVIGADLGTGPLVLIWRPGMERPARLPIPPTGGGTTGPPALLVLADQSSR
jgi:hypothetical protein